MTEKTIRMARRFSTLHQHQVHQNAVVEKVKVEISLAIE
jgi:hypothetical protein